MSYSHVPVLEESVREPIGVLGSVSGRQCWLWSVYGRKNPGRREPASSGRAGRKELTGQDRQGENVEETGDRDTQTYWITVSYREEVHRVEGIWRKVVRQLKQRLLLSQAGYPTLRLFWYRPKHLRASVRDWKLAWSVLFIYSLISSLIQSKYVI